MGCRVGGWGLNRNEKRFRGGLVFKARRRSYHSTLGSRVIKKRGRIFIKLLTSDHKLKASSEGSK